jgi:lipoprotein-releasing system permease protein
MNFRGPFEDYEKVAKRVEKVKGVVASTPFINCQGIVKHSGNVSGAVIRGIDPHSVRKVLSVEPMIKLGSLDSLQGRPVGLPCIIVGSELKKKMGVKLGDTLTVTFSSRNAPKTRRFMVSGVFESGVYDYDASMAYISLNEAQAFLGLEGRVSGLAVKVKDIYSSHITANAIQDKLGYPFRTQDWKEMNRNIFASLKLQKTTFFIILTMIVLVGALNIVSTLVMVVMEKTRDVAILRAMGASSKSIMSIFMLQGLLVGVVGTLLGLASGLGVCYLLEKYKFITLPPDVYSLSNLSVQVQTGDVLLVASSAVVISFLATVYPSWSASKLNPVEAIRYE